MQNENHDEADALNSQWQDDRHYWIEFFKSALIGRSSCPDNYSTENVALDAADIAERAVKLFRDKEADVAHRVDNLRKGVAVCYGD